MIVCIVINHVRNSITSHRESKKRYSLTQGRLFSWKTVVLTTECLCSPTVDPGFGLLAHRGVRAEGIAECRRVAIIHAHVINTVIIVLLWIHFAVTVLKGTSLVLEDATGCSEILVRLCVDVTHRAFLAFACVFAPRVILHFPAYTKLGWVFGIGVVGCKHVVVTIAIEVSTQATHHSTVGAWESNWHIASPIILHFQAKLGFNHSSPASSENWQPSLLQCNWQVYKNVKLESKREDLMSVFHREFTVKSKKNMLSFCVIANFVPQKTNKNSVLIVSL